MYQKLKPNGKIVIVVPCEQPSEDGFNFREDDVNFHLYTWVPATLGNLAKAAGFKVIESKAFRHQFVPDYQKTWNKPNFHKRCRRYAQKNNNYQVKLVAAKILNEP